jgi:hypothetical protein
LVELSSKLRSYINKHIEEGLEQSESVISEASLRKLLDLMHAQQDAVRLRLTET